MNVACPSCSTRYSVDDSRIPPSGVTIKCPKCQHVFVAKREASQIAAPPRGQSAVALPGSVAPGARGNPVALPGKAAPKPQVQAPPPAAPARPAPSGEHEDLDLGLDEHAPAPVPSRASPPAPAPKPAPAAAAPKPSLSKAPAPGRSPAEALDFIDETAEKAGVKGSRSPGEPEYRVRRRNGRVEGPFGAGRIITMIKNKELNGGEDISEDGLSWRSMTSNPQFNQVLNELAAAEDALSFGNVAFGASSSGAASPRPGGASIKPAARTGGGGIELASPLDGIAGGGPAHSDLDLGLEDEAGHDAPAALPPIGPKKPSLPYGPGIDGGEDLDLDRPGGAPPPSPQKKPAPGKEGGEAKASGQGGGDALEVGDIPELPPIWQTYKRPIIAFVAVVSLVLAGVFSHLFTPCGAFGVKCVAAMFEPPPPPPPQAPPPPPPKVADPKEIASLIDEGSYEAFRSVLATVEKLGPTLPDNMLAAAKARGLASLAYGTQWFPIADLASSIEGLNTLDLGKALGGNATLANLEILKARAALEIHGNLLDSAIGQLNTALEQRGDDKELSMLLGLARAKQGDSKGALEALDKAVVSDRAYAPALHAIGDIVLAGGQLEEAAEWYMKALQAQPAHSRSAVAAAALYAKLERHGHRRRVLAMAGDKVQRGLPPEQRAAFLFDTASAFEAADQAGRGVAFAEEAARLEPASPKYIALAAVALASAGDPKKAQALLDPLITREKSFDALLARARVFLAQQDVAKAFIDLEAAKKLEAKDLQALLLWEARFNLELAKLADAREALTRAIKAEGAGPAPFIELGRIELSVGDVDAAFKAASEAVARSGSSAAAHALLGDCLRLRGEMEKAEAEYKRAIELDDENVAANLGYANALRDAGGKSAKARGKVAESIPIYLRLLAENPKNPTVMFEYGRALELMQDVTGALALYREAATLDEKDVRPHLKMAAAYLEQPAPDAAAATRSVEIARKIEAGSGIVNGHVRFWEGRLALQEKRLHDAEGALRLAVEAEPRNAEFHFWLARALEENNSLYEAINYYEKAVSLNSRLAVAQRALGRTAIERNQFDKAREWFEKYRESAPDDVSIWIDIGESFTRQNREDEAFQAFERADPRNPRALVEMGGILLNKGKDSEAEKLFKRATEADPEYGDAWCHYGQSLAKKQVSKEARKALERCVELPSSADDLKNNAKETLETAAAR